MCERRARSTSIFEASESSPIVGPVDAHQQREPDVAETDDGRDGLALADACGEALERIHVQIVRHLEAHGVLIDGT